MELISGALGCSKLLMPTGSCCNSTSSSLAVLYGRTDYSAVAGKLRDSIVCPTSAPVFCQASTSAVTENPAKERGVRLEGFVEQEKKKKPLKQHRTWNAGQRTSAEKFQKKLKQLKRSAAREDRSGAADGSSLNQYASGQATGVKAFVEDDSDCDKDELELEWDEEEKMAAAQQVVPLANAYSGSELNCQHFSRCSGCVLDTALDRPPVLREAENYFAQFGIQDFSFYSGNVWAWRCRAKLAVRGTSDNPQIGIYEEGSHSVVSIPSCRVHHPRINEAVELLKAAIIELSIQPYDESSGSGELRYVQMVVSTHNTALPDSERYANGKVQISLVWNARSEDSFEARQLKPTAELLWQKGGVKSTKPIIHSVWANFQTTRTNVIFGGRWRHMLGERDFWERLGGVNICFTPSSFGQANLQAFDALLRRLQRFVKHGSKVVELYAGVGTIGLSLAVQRSCRTVRCVEVNKASKGPFEMSLARLPASVESKISWHCADASVTPIQWLQGSEVVIVDPPRKGLDATVIEALRTASLRGQGKTKSPSNIVLDKVEKRPWILRAKQAAVQTDGPEDLDYDEQTWPETLIYVSCGWEAFKADSTALLSGNAWHLAEAAAFNLFPGTNSMEVVAVFKRGRKTRSQTKGTITKARLAKGKAKKHARSMQKCASSR